MSSSQSNLSCNVQSSIEISIFNVEHEANTNTRDLACAVGGWKCGYGRRNVAASGWVMWDGVCHQNMESIELNWRYVRSI